MKKITLLALLLCNVCSVLAQTNVLETTGRFGICPGFITSSKKSVLISYDHSEGNDIKIYDENLNVAKTITPTTKKHQVSTWTESARVVPTGFEYAYYKVNYNYPGVIEAELSSLDIYPYYNEVDMTGVCTPEAFLQKLQDAGKINEWESFTAFYDFKGNPAITQSGFRYETALGKKYPWNDFYVLINGEVYRINNPIYGSVKYDASSANWIKGEEFPGIVEDEIIYTDYRDGDNSFCHDGVEAIVSQTIFNDDDKWEYAVEEKKVISILDSKDYFVGGMSPVDNYDGTITVTRTNGTTTEFDKTVIYNEDGEVCYTLDIELDDVWRLYGKLYATGTNGMKYANILYEIDTKSSNVREVARVKYSAVNYENGVLNVEVDGEMSGSDVIVSRLNGTIVGKGSVKAGETNARVAMPTNVPGVYVISLQRNGKVIQGERIVIR